MGIGRRPLSKRTKGALPWTMHSHGGLDTAQQEDRACGLSRGPASMQAGEPGFGGVRLGCSWGMTWSLDSLVDLADLGLVVRASVCGVAVCPVVPVGDFLLPCFCSPVFCFVLILFLVTWAAILKMAMCSKATVVDCCCLVVNWSTYYNKSFSFTLALFLV